jgi:carbon monoxide dehydrogenase subunit G
MIVTGEHTFPGPRERVWTLLQDPDVLVKAMPGAKRLSITGDGTYEGVVRIGVGPVTAAEWRLSVELHDRDEPASYVMHVDTKGPLGFTRGTATVALVEVDEGTRMLYHADLSVGGKVASVGQRLLDQVAKMLTKQGLNALNKEMEARLLAGVVVEEWTGDDEAVLDADDLESDADAAVFVEVEVRETIIDVDLSDTALDPAAPGDAGDSGDAWDADDGASAGDPDRSGDADSAADRDGGVAGDGDRGAGGAGEGR